LSHLTLAWLTVLPWAASGCVAPPSRGGDADRVALKNRAMDVLHAAISYQGNPAVRVEAVEALEACPAAEATPWIRTALRDSEPAVRFAASVACGRLRDGAAEDRLRELAGDGDRNVQVAALFALHRLGHRERTGLIPNYLLVEQGVGVRRNAALLLGLLDEPSAVKVLARGMRDADAGVRQHALEAMARLGNREARQELVFMTNAGVGSDEVMAINALSETNDPVYEDAFRRKLATADHVETRLAAARGLGRLGSDVGFEVAMRALRSKPPVRGDPHDPAASKVLRIRQMATAALGEIGRVDALPTLNELLTDQSDPRVQVSAARAIVRIIEADRGGALPFGTGVRKRRNVEKSKRATRL